MPEAPLELAHIVFHQAHLALLAIRNTMPLQMCGNFMTRNDRANIAST